MEFIIGHSGRHCDAVSVTPDFASGTMASGRQQLDRCTKKAFEFSGSDWVCHGRTHLRRACGCGCPDRLRIPAATRGQDRLPMFTASSECRRIDFRAPRCRWSVLEYFTGLHRVAPAGSAAAQRERGAVPRRIPASDRFPARSGWREDRSQRCRRSQYTIGRLALGAGYAFVARTDCFCFLGIATLRFWRTPAGAGSCRADP